MHYKKQKEGTLPFIYIEQELYELRCKYEQLAGYEEDRIKFMTKVEVDESKRQGVCGNIEIVREPIFCKNDVITFLLFFKWYTNVTKTNNKIRKGSFATGKEASFYRSRYNKNKIQQQELLHIVFLLSQKIYIEDRFIDLFVNVVAQKGQIHYRQLNCLTILLLGGESKHRIGNMASTQAETNKYQHYSFESLSMCNSMAQVQKHNGNSNNEHHVNKYSHLLKRSSISSRYYEISPRVSITLVENMDQAYFKNDIRFNLQKTKKYFSAIEYLTSATDLNIQMIIMQLGQDKNSIEGGLHFDTVREVISQWPKHNSYGSIYKMNKQKLMQDLLKQAISNYKLMASIQLQDIQNLNPDQIYRIISEFNSKINEQFLIATKEYINQSDYDSYLKRLERQILKLENEVFNNFAVTKEEYGSRVIKNLSKQNFNNSIETYMLLRIIGREELSHLNIGYPMYKKLIEPKLQQCFAQFLSKKFKGSVYRMNSSNNNENDLINIQNRIEILQGKKKNLFSGIQLAQKDQQQLLMMLNRLKSADQADSVKSQLPNQ